MDQLSKKSSPWNNRLSPSVMIGRLSILYILLLGRLSAGQDTPVATSSTEIPDVTVTNPSSTVSTSDPTSPPNSSTPRCRTLFAHGDTGGKDGVDYSTLLLWREHATLDGTTWTLAVNVTATEGARVMLGSAARALPGQPHYELVLGATTGTSRLIAHHVKGESQPPGPNDKTQHRLFDEGDLQLWIRWTVGDEGRGVLDVIVLPANQSTATPLFSYTTTKPIQVETFSFGSTTPGDVAFTVCTTPPSAQPDDHQHGLLGVRGCRSIFVHVQSTHDNVHNLALSWVDVADHHGRLQFWTRASTDVEVMVSESLQRKRMDPPYHVVFGGDFNTRSWMVGYVRGSTRILPTDTPALLSDFEFRPLWLSVSPHGVFKAGTGKSPSGGRTLMSWTHPRKPTPKFISFATFKQRLVHVLIDCAKSPSQTAETYPTDMLSTVRGLVTASLVSPLAALHGPIAHLDVQTIVIHKEIMTVTGTLTKEWQHMEGMNWNPNWFHGVQKIQFWLRGADTKEIPSLAVVSSHADEQVKTKFETGPMEVNASKVIKWNFPMSLKFPCKEDPSEQTISCSASFQLSSRSLDCGIKTSMHIDHKWKTEWNITQSKVSESCIIRIKVTSGDRKKNNVTNSIKTFPTPSLQRSYHSCFHWMGVVLTIIAVITLVISNKRECTKIYSLWKKFRISKKIFLSEQEEEDKAFIVGYDGGSVQILEPKADCPPHEFEGNQNIKCLCKGRKNQHSESQTWFFFTNSLQMTVFLLLTSLVMSLLDLLVRI